VYGVAVIISVAMGRRQPANRPWTRFWDSCKSDEKCEHNYAKDWKSLMWL